MSETPNVQSSTPASAPKAAPSAAAPASPSAFSSPGALASIAARDQANSPSAPVKPADKLQAGQQSSKTENLNGAVPASSGSPSTTASKPEELHEIKIDGKTQKMTVAELKAHASMSFAAQKRFSEAAQIKKQNEGLISKFKGSPIEALMDPALGYTKEQIREKMEEWYTREFIEPSKLTPEQLRLRDAESRIARYEQEEKDRKRKFHDDNMARLTNIQREQLQGDIIKTLEESSLPKTKYTIGRIAYWMQKNIDSNLDAPMSVIIRQVQKERNEEIQSQVEAADGDTLIALLGEKTVNKIRKYDLARLTPSFSPTSPKPVVAEAPTPAKSDDDKTSMMSVSKRLREAIRTGMY